MSNDLTVYDGLSVGDLLAQTREHCEDEENMTVGAVQSRWKAGGALRALRGRARHGDWLSWLGRIGISHQRAGEAMHIHENWAYEDLPKTVRAALSGPKVPTVGTLKAPADSDYLRKEPLTQSDESPPAKDVGTGAQRHVFDPPAESGTDDSAERREVEGEHIPAEPPKTPTRLERALEDRDEAREAARDAERRAAEAERAAERDRAAREAAEAANSNAQVAGIKVQQAENRVDTLNSRIARLNEEANDLRATVRSLRRRDADVRRAFERVGADDPDVGARIEPVMARFWGEK